MALAGTNLKMKALSLVCMSLYKLKNKDSLGSTLNYMLLYYLKNDSEGYG